VFEASPSGARGEERLQAAKHLVRNRGVLPNHTTGEYPNNLLTSELTRRGWEIEIQLDEEGHQVTIDRLVTKHEHRAKIVIFARTLNVALVHALDRAIRDDEATDDCK
jgi:hypothetical protein